MIPAQPEVVERLANRIEELANDYLLLHHHHYVRLTGPVSKALFFAMGSVIAEEMRK